MLALGLAELPGREQVVYCFSRRECRVAQGEDQTSAGRLHSCGVGTAEKKIKSQII